MRLWPCPQDTRVAFMPSPVEICWLPTHKSQDIQRNWGRTSLALCASDDKEEKLLMADSWFNNEMQGSVWGPRQPNSWKGFAFLFGNYQWVIIGWNPNRVLSLLEARTCLQNCGVGQVYVGYQPPHLTFQLLSIFQNRNLLSLGAGLPGTRLDS